MKNTYVAELIYAYVVENKSLANIAAEYNLPVSEVTNELRACGIAGENNATGETNFKGGAYKGKYRSGEYTLTVPKSEDETIVDLDIKVLSDYVAKRRKDDTLEDYLDRVYGGKSKNKLFNFGNLLDSVDEDSDDIVNLNNTVGSGGTGIKNILGSFEDIGHNNTYNKKVKKGINLNIKGKLVGGLVLLLLFLCCFNTKYLLGLDYQSRVRATQGGFFYVLSGNIQNAMRFSLAGKAVAHVKMLMWQKEVEQINKENQELIDFRTREDTAENVSLYTLHGTKYIGKKLEDNPYMDCFSLTTGDPVYRIGNYDENGELNDRALMYQFIDFEEGEAYASAEIGVYSHGKYMSGIRAKADLVSGITVGNYNSDGSLYGLQINKTVGGEFRLLDSSNEQVGSYDKELDCWVDMTGEEIKTGRLCHRV